MLLNDQPDVAVDDPSERSHCQRWWTTSQKQLLEKLRAEGVDWPAVAIRCGHTVGSCRTTLSNMQDRHLVRAAGDPKPKIMRKPWTEAEVVRLIHAYEIDGLRFREIDAELKRPKGSSCVKYESLRRPAARSFISKEAKVVIDQAAFDAREARKHAEMQRSITQNFFGDPPPGYSALDRRKQA
jgi:hypothetical protein